jgi:hypothetical protein
MKLRYILSMIAIVAVTKNSFAQFSQDAIRFSTTQPGSTARIKAVGNANVALGGDLTSVSGNPAGLGFFTKSEFSITPELDMFKVNATYNGNVTNDKKNTGNLSNAAIVFYNRLATSGSDKTKGWLSVNYGLGYSRTNDFYQNVNYGTPNNLNSSISDYYANRAQNSESDLLGKWGYDQYLVDQDGQSYFSNVNRGNGNTLRQTANIVNSGGQSEFNLAIGANHSNKFYLGGSIGIATIRYNSTKYFEEIGNATISDDPADRNLDFTSTFRQNQITRGTGANLKLGMIYKPVDAVRFGFNFTSPTWYDMQDTYSERLSTKINSVSPGDDGESYDTRYVLRTPLKVAGGLALFIKQYGFITGDIEYVDYSGTNLSSSEDTPDYDGSGDNADIKDFYKGAVNYRLGAEARLSKFAYLRGGYNILGNPMKENGSTIKTASGGVGFRSGNYSVDATYSHVTGSQTIFPYEIGDASPGAFLKRTNDNVYLTVSYRF